MHICETWINDTMPSVLETRLHSRILGENRVRREIFDPTNRDHMESYQNFLKTGNWGKVQFYEEFPYVTVPETVSRKFAMHALAEKLGTSS